VSAAAALATIRLLKEALIANADAVGRHLISGLRLLMDTHPLIGDVRGLGLMIGVELVRNRDTKERAIEERGRLVQEMFQRGVLILGAGANALRFAPPLVLTKAQADAVVDIFDKALGAITRSPPG
jgi:4-aminobutyrate aminotransferase